MSQENVEIVRRLYESGAVDGDHEALREALDPDVVYINPPEAVEPGTRRGVDDVIAGAKGAAKSFGATKHTVREVFDAGDTVVAFVTAQAWGRDSGIPVSQEEAHTWTFRDGKVISFEWSRDLRAALAAVGLSE